MNIKTHIDYNKDTGVFTWIKPTSNSVRVGQVAGTPDKDGYIVIRFNKKHIKAHRLAWFYVYGRWPVNHIDHINQIKNDNRISNLRDITANENRLNTKLYASNSTGVHGVYFHKKSKKYCAQLSKDKKHYYGGLHNNLDEARKWVDSKLKELGFHPNHGI